MKQDGEWVSGKIRIPEGARLGTSTGTPGADSSLLFDSKSGKTLGPAEVKVGGGSNLTETIIAAAVSGVITLAVAQAPEIKKRVQEDVIPSVKAKWDKFKATQKRNHSRGIETNDTQEGIEVDSPVTGKLPDSDGDGRPETYPTA